MLSTCNTRRPGNDVAGRFALLFLAAALVLSLLPSAAAQAATAAELGRDGSAALKKLYARGPEGEGTGGQGQGHPGLSQHRQGGVHGRRPLRRRGPLQGRQGGRYYSTVAASYGYQAGVQKYGYAMLLMNDKALEYLNKSDGWELGTGPSIVVVDEGVAGGLSTSTARDDVYAFIFGQTGLMAGLGLQGSKITKIEK